MKKINIMYWICTGIIVLFLGYGSVVGILSGSASLEVFRKLGYPDYLAKFLDMARLFGLAVILMPVPQYKRLKEWAYAGLSFDLAGALYSHIAVGDPVTNYVFVLLPILFLAGSYIFYHKKLRAYTTVTKDHESY